MENRLMITKYSEQYYPPTPNNFTLFLRRSILFQIIRFFILNYKILKILIKGHS
jgi:hypothetical protein